MSFDRDNRDKLEIDDLNIKHILNNSLENEGISVSEDLISRTLEAIKKQQADDSTDKGKDEKIKPVSLLRKTRIWISAAAAVLLLLIGMNAIRFLSPEKKADQEFSKSDNMENGEENAYSMLTEKDGKTTEAGTGDELMKSAGEATAQSEAFSEDANDANTEEKTTEIYADATGEDDSDTNLMMGISSVLNVDEVEFSEIAGMEPADIKSVEITAMNGNRTITLTEKEQVEKFCSIMGNHSFVRETEGKSDEQFLIEIFGKEKESRLIIGSNSVDVETVDKDMVSHSIYSAVDQSRLMEDLNQFLQQ
jgi:hypothetical protein